MLPVQLVGYEEGVISVWVIKLTQQFGKAGMDIVIAITGCQALQTHARDLLILHWTSGGWEEALHCVGTSIFKSFESVRKTYKKNYYLEAPLQVFLIHVPSLTFSTYCSSNKPKKIKNTFCDVTKGHRNLSRVGDKLLTLRRYLGSLLCACLCCICCRSWPRDDSKSLIGLCAVCSSCACSGCAPSSGSAPASGCAPSAGCGLSDSVKPRTWRGHR